MPVKRAESSFKETLKAYDWRWHKYGDVRYCIHCHKPLPKSENAPDFSAWVVYTWVECKNSNSTGRWVWTEISEGGDRANQRAWLIENGGWLYIELGTGRAPKGKSAYLVPFKHWLNRIEPFLIENGMKSIRKETIGNRPGADDFLALWRLDWRNSHWEIPKNHYWWYSLRTALYKELEFVEGKIDE